MENRLEPCSFFSFFLWNPFIPINGKLRDVPTTFLFFHKTFVFKKHVEYGMEISKKCFFACFFFGFCISFLFPQSEPYVFKILSYRFSERTKRQFACRT